MVRVEAADENSAVTRVIRTNDDAAYDMANDEIDRALRGGQIPTPALVGLGIAGHGATLNRID